jgi:hypothetical protein
MGVPVSPASAAGTLRRYRIFHTNASREVDILRLIISSKNPKIIMSRFDVLEQIKQLDPERDNMKIIHLLFGYEFS